MTTSLAPRSFLAAAMWVIKFTWVETGLPPQITIRSDLAISRPSTPRLTPTPASQPASDSILQIDRCSRIAHRVAQPVEAVALHQSHRARVIIGPHRLGAVALCCPRQLFGDLVERVLPGNRHESRRADALLANPPQRPR